MPPRYVIADRTDALGGRLMVLLNGLRLAKHHDAKFLMTWLTGPGRFLEIIAPIHEIFTGDLIAPFDEESGTGTIIPSDHALLRSSRARLQSLEVEESQIYGFKDVFFRPVVDDKRPYAVRARFANYCLVGESFDQARSELAVLFESLGKSPAIESAIGSLKERLEGRGKLASLHVRRQDLLSHTHVQANRFESYCTLESCKLLIDQKADSYDSFLVSSDSNYLVEELKSAYPDKVIAPDDVLDLFELTALQKAMMGIVFLSRGQEIFGPLSAYGTTASIIGPGKYRNLHPYLARHNLLQGDRTGAVRLFKEQAAGNLGDYLKTVTLLAGESGRAMHLALRAPVSEAALNMAIRALAMRVCELSLPYTSGRDCFRYFHTIKHHAEALSSPLLPEIAEISEALDRDDRTASASAKRMSLDDRSRAMLVLVQWVLDADKEANAKQNTQALALYHQARVLAEKLSVNPRGLLLRQAGLQAEMGNQEAAVSDYRTAVNVDPTFAHSHFLLACALRQAGQRDEALKAGLTATNLDPYVGQYWDFCSHLHKEQGQLEEQLDCSKKALACDPENQHYKRALLVSGAPKTTVV